MTQEEKELLLKDLCARLPYNVKAYESPDYPSITITSFDGDRFLDGDGWEHEVGTFKPYLRPMSSLTEKEKKELGTISCEYDTIHKWAVFYKSQDWLNKNHFDYRGLIEKGLALEMTKSQ